MRVLLDAAHAADVWTLGSVEDRLLAAGETTLWLSRPGKELVDHLIDARGRPRIVGPSAGRSAGTLLVELARRDWRAWRVVRRFRPDVILTRSPAGVHAGRLAGVPVLYDTDDGDAAGLVYRVAGPLADLVTSPSATRTRGDRHRAYRGYKELCYLHPARFSPDPSVRSALGLGDEELLFVVRLTAFTAGHDLSERGMTPQLVDALVARLRTAGRVVVSSEAPLRAGLRELGLTTPPDRFHHVLAASDLVVSDGQTVCSEAAVLGVPVMRFNSWAGRHQYQVELERRWGLLRGFGLHEEAAFLAEIEAALGDLRSRREEHAARRSRMLGWCDDPVDELVRSTYEVARRPVSGRAVRHGISGRLRRRRVAPCLGSPSDAPCGSGVDD